jgi:hypothetical protein
LGVLGLVLNAVILWQTLYMDAAINQLRSDGIEISNKARLSPLLYNNINFLGRYSFALHCQRQLKKEN